MKPDAARWWMVSVLAHAVILAFAAVASIEIETASEEERNLVPLVAVVEPMEHWDSHDIRRLFPEDGTDSDDNVGIGTVDGAAKKCKCGPREIQTGERLWIVPCVCGEAREGAPRGCECADAPKAIDIEWVDEAEFKKMMEGDPSEFERIEKKLKKGTAKLK